jgi:uncharacterized protein (TIGR03435 family)
MGRCQSTWLGFLTLLPLLSATQQPDPVSEQTPNKHLFQQPALGSVFTQAGATQLSVPQPHTPPPSAPAAFEVSTVKLNKSGSGNSGSDFANGRFTATNIQLKNLMEYSAYGIPQPRIVGGPKWLGSERFNFEAKMESAAAERLKTLSRDQRRAETQAMFQRLLADRFKLAVDWETRELPVYALVAVKNGPSFQESKNAPGEGGTSSGDGRFSAKGMTLTEIAEALTQELSRELGRVVIDKTGIQGRYDIVLKMDAGNRRGCREQRHRQFDTTVRCWSFNIYRAQRAGWAEARIGKRPGQGPCHRSCRDAHGELTRRSYRMVGYGETNKFLSSVS